MSSSNILRIASRRLGTLRRARSGNVAVIFSLAVVPILGVVGAAVDFSNTSGVRSKLQVAADAAAISGDLVSPWSRAQCERVARRKLESTLAANAIVPAEQPVIDCSSSGTGVFVETVVPTYVLRAVFAETVDVSVAAQTRCVATRSEETPTASPTMVFIGNPVPNRTRIVTMGHVGADGVARYFKTPEGNPIIRLDNPHDGPATISVRAAHSGLVVSYDVPSQGQFIVVWPENRPGNN